MVSVISNKSLILRLCINTDQKAPDDISKAWEVLWRCFPNVRKAGMQVESILGL
jgi:hypothetical protein